MPEPSPPSRRPQRRARDPRSGFLSRGLFLVAGLLGLAALAFLLSRRAEESPSLPPGFSTASRTSPDTPRGGETASSLEGILPASLPGEGSAFEASIAVLPFQNRSRDAAYDTLCDRMTDELNARLVRVTGLKVISRNSVQGLMGLGLSLERIADTLDVDHLLEGVVEPYNQGARLQVRLHRIGWAEPVLWSNSYSLDAVNQQRALEEVSNEVYGALLAEAPDFLAVRGSFRATESPGYVSYLAANRWLNTRTRSGIIQAIAAYQDAIAFDPGLAPALAGISSAFALSVTYRYRIGLDAYAAAALALRAADSAVALDPNLAEGFAARGYISSLALAPARTVYADFARALELQPNAPNVPAWYANLLVREGFYEQALAEAQRAVELDPLSPARRTGLAYEALRARAYGLAIEQARAARTLEESVILPRSIQALALLLSGRAEECLTLDLGPHAGLRATCLHEMGRLEEAAAIVDSLRARLRSGNHTHPDFTDVIGAGDLASYFAWTGDPLRALPWMERAYALSPNGIDPRVLESGIFDSLMRNPALRAQVEEIRRGIWDRVLREAADAGLEG